jgi:hypothetical protein
LEAVSVVADHVVSGLDELATDRRADPSVATVADLRKDILDIEWLVTVKASRTIVAASSARRRVFRLLPEE